MNNFKLYPQTAICPTWNGTVKAEMSQKVDNVIFNKTVFLIDGTAYVINPTGFKDDEPSFEIRCHGNRIGFGYYDSKYNEYTFFNLNHYSRTDKNIFISAAQYVANL